MQMNRLVCWSANALFSTMAMLVALVVARTLNGEPFTNVWRGHTAPFPNVVDSLLRQAWDLIGLYNADLIRSPQPDKML